MARPYVTPAVIAELEASHNRPIYLFEGDFAGGWLFLTTRSQDVTWDGNTYVANGIFRGFTGLRESLAVDFSGMQVQFSGVSNEMLTIALDSTIQGKPARVRLAFLDASGDIIPDPILLFDGIVDVPSIIEKPDGADLTLALESKFVLFERAKSYRYSTESHKLFYPGDTGFRYALRLDKQKLNWGKKEDSPSTAAKNRTRQASDRRNSGPNHAR